MFMYLSFGHNIKWVQCHFISSIALGMFFLGTEEIVRVKRGKRNFGHKLIPSFIVDKMRFYSKKEKETRNKMTLY